MSAKRKRKTMNSASAALNDAGSDPDPAPASDGKRIKSSSQEFKTRGRTTNNSISSSTLFQTDDFSLISDNPSSNNNNSSNRKTTKSNKNNLDEVEDDLEIGEQEPFDDNNNGNDNNNNDDGDGDGNVDGDGDDNNDSNRNEDDQIEGDGNDDNLEVEKEMDSEEKILIRTKMIESLEQIKQSYISMNAKFVKEQLSLIEMELAALEDGSHPEFLARLEENEQSKISQLKVLENSFQFLCKNIIHHHESMVSEAMNSYQKDKQVLKLDLSQDLTHRILVLHQNWSQVGACKNTRLFINRFTMDDKSKSIRPVRLEPYSLLDHQYIRVGAESQETEEDLKLMKGEISIDSKVFVKGPLISNGSASMDSSAFVGNQNLASNAPNSSFQTPVEMHESTFHDITFENGKLRVENSLLERDQQVIIEDRNSGIYSGIITAINSSEVWVRKSDGSRTKLYISQMRMGKYLIRPANAN